MKTRRFVIFFLVISVIFSTPAYAGRKKDFRERMKTIGKVAVLPLDYELIVPSAMHSDKQRKDFGDEETEEKRNMRISQFAEKFKGLLEKKGYDTTFINADDETGNVRKLISKMQDIRGEIQEKLGQKGQETFISDEIGQIAKQIPDVANSEIFIIPLCRDRMATGGEALTQSFGMVGYMAGAESWKDDYMGYVPWATYTYIHAFVVDSRTFEVLYLMSAIKRDSLFRTKSVAIGLANEMSQQFPKRKAKEMPYWY